MGTRGIRCSVQERRLHCYGHVMCMEDDSGLKKCQAIQVEGTCGRGRPRKTWVNVVKTNLRMLNLTKEMSSDHVKWLDGVLEKT